MPDPYVMAFPLAVHEGKTEFFTMEDGEIYNVSAAATAIMASPDDFHFLMINLLPFEAQIKSIHTDDDYVAAMPDAQAGRPIIVGTSPEGAVRIIDGYHRARAVMLRGATWTYGFVLTPEQTARFRLA